MALNVPVFFTRLGSAVVFAVIMMLGFLWNMEAFTVLWLFIQFLCLKEYKNLLNKIFPGFPVSNILGILLQIVALLAVAALYIVMRYKDADYKSYAFVLVCLPVLVLLISGLSAKRDSLQAGIAALSSLFYITLPVLSVIYLYSLHFALPLALLLMIWMNDTMAYLVGSFIGKTPFSAISPKKTWEGTIGGVILTLTGAAIWGCYAPVYSIQDWMAYALCAAVAGTSGDLLESKIKRLAGVKDSGNIMPGHGGALDRFDSMLVAIPFAFAYTILFM